MRSFPSKSLVLGLVPSACACSSAAQDRADSSQRTRTVPTSIRIRSTRSQRYIRRVRFLGRPVFISLLLALITTSSAAQNRAKASLIREKMRALRPFVGSWSAATVFHERQLGVAETKEVGTYAISFVLDSTYLKWEILLRRTDNGRVRSMMILLTYNPDSVRYEGNYFYNGSPLKVFEVGEYNSAREQLRTTAFIPREDGIRDENVRTVTTVDPTRIVYEHYSRHSDEPAEWNDFSAVLRRVRGR
jgi:hypothetical protein